MTKREELEDIKMQILDGAIGDNTVREMLNSQQFVLYDDEGLIIAGDRAKCCEFLIVWAKSKEAKELYSRDELRKLIVVFSKDIEDEISYMGFSLVYMENYEELIVTDDNGVVENRDMGGLFL